MLLTSHTRQTIEHLQLIPAATCIAMLRITDTLHKLLILWQSPYEFSIPDT